MPKIPIREKVPIRRTNPVKKSKYGEYFDQLREDFNNRCGYCDSFDIRRNNDFEIDHFIPQRVFSKLKPNDYHNLVYSCKSCNRSKSGKWPSNDENINTRDGKGFIDPCDAKFDTHFSRYNNGEIDWESDLGKWMYIELSFYNPKHSIIWKLEKLRKAIEEAKKMAEKDPDNLKISKGLNVLFLIQENYLDRLFDVA
jgi:uncharacterized protein (TIGR02646 family)